MTVTDDDAKTRAQREKLDEITSSTSDENGTDVVPKVVRDSTMTATAEVGWASLPIEVLEVTRMSGGVGLEGLLMRYCTVHYLFLILITGGKNCW